MSHHAGGSQGVAWQGIAANFALVAAAAQKLGGIPPLMAEQADFAEHGPEAKATALYLAHLCSRLLDLSREDRAAHVMQRRWRQHRHRKPGKHPLVMSCSRVCCSSIPRSHVTPCLLPRPHIAESSVHICCCTRLVAAVAQEGNQATWSSLSLHILRLQPLLTQQPTWCWATARELVLHSHWHAGVVAAWPAFAADRTRMPALVLKVIRLTATGKASSG